MSKQWEIKKIGSTLKGIGPCYQDKIGRHGLRVGDILSKDFKKRYLDLVEKHKRVLDHFKSSQDPHALDKDFFESIEMLQSFNLVDSEYYLNYELNQGKHILAEGAQGSMLDIDFGSYPFVTSSSTMVAGAASGLGVAPKHFGEVYGIIKAYSTRVGGGPFLTELSDEVGEYLRTKGHEFGSTTGRPRRTGWLDIPAVKYAIMLNAVSKLFVMKVDVLDDFDEIKVCTEYTNGNETSSIFSHEVLNGDFKPNYHTLQGWKTSTNNLKSVQDIPAALTSYLSFLENVLSTKIALVSTGPDRSQTVLL